MVRSDDDGYEQSDRTRLLLLLLLNSVPEQIIPLLGLAEDSRQYPLPPDARNAREKKKRRKNGRFLF